MSVIEPMLDVITRNFGEGDSRRRGMKAWIRVRGPIVLTSKWRRTVSGDVSRTGAMPSRRPALERRTSILDMLCLDLRISTAVDGSESIVASSLTMMILLSLPTGTVLRELVAVDVSRTAAMMVVFGRVMRADRMPFPMPLPAPVMRYVSSDIIDKVEFVEPRTTTVEYCWRNKPLMVLGAM